MRKIFMLAIANIRKKKGQMAAIFSMILIGAALFNLGAITWLNFGKNFDKKSKELNSEHSMVVVQKKDYRESLYDYIKSNEKVTAAEKRSVLYANTKFSYANGDMSMPTVFMNLSDKIEIGKIFFVEKSQEVFEKPIYLPYLLKTGGGYEIGDSFAMTIGTSTYNYRVAGFFEDMFLGSVNMGAIGMTMDDATYHDLEKKLGDSSQSVLLLTQLENVDEAVNFTSDVYSYFKSQVNEDELPFAVSNSYNSSYSQVKMARTLIVSIVYMIVVAFSIIIVLISLIVIKFQIGNNIDENMQNIGALKAMGYTSRQIILSILFQFTSVATVGVIAGTVVSYVMLPSLSNVYAAQSGILWNQGFDLVSTLITIGVMLVMVILTSFLSARKIRTLHPILALRNGIHTHNFRKNHLPLERLDGNLNILLSLKSTLQNAKQNFMIVLIIAAISFASLFAGVLYYNIAVNDKVFLDTIAGELASITFTLNPENYDDTLIANIRQMPDVEKALYFDQSLVTTDGNNVFLYITEDYSKTENVMCYEGRNPKHDNEVAIGGGMAKDLDKKVGDMITFELGNIEKEYLITGLIQSGNGAGYDTEITTRGFMQLNKNYKPAVIYVYLKGSTNSENFIEKVTNLYGNSIGEPMDFNKMIDSQRGMFNMIVSMIVGVIILITMTVVTLILYLVIKMVIIRKRCELGIQKALGFTTKQLIFQLSFSFLPIVAIGTILGGAAGYFGTNPMLSVLFRSMGIMKMDFIIQPIMIIGLCIGICVFAFLVSLLVSIRIRRISAYLLIQE